MLERQGLGGGRVKWGRRGGGVHSSGMRRRHQQLEESNVFGFLFFPVDGSPLLWTCDDKGKREWWKNKSRGYR